MNYSREIERKKKLYNLKREQAKRLLEHIAALKSEIDNLVEKDEEDRGNKYVKEIED